MCYYFGMKTDRRPPQTSQSANAKLRRAINQLENVRVLLSSMPKKVWKKKRHALTGLIEEVDAITEKTRTELANHSENKKR
jgi:hypothetical protein